MNGESNGLGSGDHPERRALRRLTISRLPSRRGFVAFNDFSGVIAPPSAIRRRNLELMEKAQADLHGERAHNDYDAGMDQTMRECDESPPPRLLEGIAQFNRGEYFEQHETLELLWRAEPRKVRHLYQGILQIGVAFHHLRRGNYHGTI